MNLISKDEAIAAGLKRYFTGKACPAGHIDERLVSNRGCISCRKIFVARLLAKNPGYRSSDSKTYRLRNPEKVKESNRLYRLSNAEKIKLANASYRARNRVRIAKYNKSNNGRASEQRRQRLMTDPTRYRKAAREWKRKNQAKVRAAALRRRALKLNAVGTHSSSDIEAILRLQDYKCAYCKVDLKKTVKHIDHITSLKRGGSNAPSNLQMLCAPCNWSKHARDPIEFAQSLGMLL